MKDWLADASGAALFVLLFFITYKWREQFSAKGIKSIN
jgi:hypothetical protein